MHSREKREERGQTVLRRRKTPSPQPSPPKSFADNVLAVVNHTCERFRGRGGQGGFTLIEVVISTLLTGVVMVAALNSLGAATKGSLEGSRRGQAMTLAAELMAEIVAGL